MRMAVMIDLSDMQTKLRCPSPGLDVLVDAACGCDDQPQ